MNLLQGVFPQCSALKAEHRTIVYNNLMSSYNVGYSWAKNILQFNHIIIPFFLKETNTINQ